MGQKERVIGISAGIVVGGAMVLLIFSMYAKFFSPEGPTTLRAAEERERILADISKRGPAAAYASLKKRFAGINDFEIGHTAAHIFGGSLYERLGADGIVYCDDWFNFGCYHQFFGAMSAKEGLDALPRIDALCSAADDATMACFHGVGHGLVGFLGYDETALREALSRCDSLSFRHPDGCYGGAFMEYNLRFLQHGPDIFNGEYRKIENGDIHAPCALVPEHVRSSCYFAQAGWLTLYLSHQKIFGFCGALQRVEDRSACIAGLGKIIPWYKPEEIRRTIAACIIAPDVEARELCLRHAAHTTLLRSGSLAGAKEICAASGSETARSACELFSPEYPDVIVPEVR